MGGGLSPLQANRIAVMGAGSMGTLLGACLTQEGLSVDLIDANREHIDSLNVDGARIQGTVDLHVMVRALMPDAINGSYDVVFLLVKQTDNEAAFDQLRPHLHERSVVCTLQNGIPEHAVAAALGKDRTLGCAVTWGATFIAPGRIQATVARPKWHSALGTLDGSITEQAKTVQGVLSLMSATALVGNLLGIRWSKLLVNCSFSGMSAALGCTFGQVLESEKALKCAQYIARECLRVADAQKIRLAPLETGLDFKRLMDFDTEERRLATCGIYHKLWGAAASGKASMLQDLEKGRKSEIEFINGLLSDTGQTYGVPTPVNDTVVRVVKGIEERRYRPCMENIEMFDCS